MRGRRPIRRAGPVANAARGPARLVQIEKPVYGGEFLARDEGKAIFVPLVLTGEQARVQIVEDRSKRGYAKAELVELATRAAERVRPPCQHFGSCGGCHYQHATYEAQLKMKQQILGEALERGGVKAPEEIAVLAGEAWQYRNRIRVAFDADGNAGYRGRRSHQVVPIRECPIAAPVLVETALAAANFFKRLDKRSGPAELGLFCDATGETVLASVFVHAQAGAWPADFCGALMKECRNIVGVEVVELRGEQARTIASAGAGSLKYRAGGFDYRVDIGAFFQVNRWLVNALIERVVGEASGGVAWDLFAGVGLFARQISARFDRGIAVESAREATDALKANLAGTTAEAVAMPVHEFLRENAGESRPDLIVVDPPRTGLGEEIVSLLNQVAAPALNYVSCDPATLARDLRGLLEGGYAIESVALVDLFPQTFHLETVVALHRA